MKLALFSTGCWLALGLTFASPGAAHAQAAPQPAAQPSFENDQVIVNAPHPAVDVPGSTRKMHDHKLNRVMVYLHPGGERLHYLDGGIVDLKWQEGEVQWSPASGFHYSEIPPELDPRVWKTPAFTGPMIVDIGIKKAGSATTKASTPLDAVRVALGAFTLEFENSQVRVLRLRLAPRQRVPLHALADRLVVYITDQHIQQVSAGQKTDTIEQHKASEFSWFGASTQTSENQDDSRVDAIVVEFKN
ncbi:MAG: hypothetical protein ND807_05410 [Vicinamibacterales bacterium]|nr:hypothetical protein [Vicinamibacterales bacterium]